MGVIVGMLVVIVDPFFSSVVGFTVGLLVGSDDGRIVGSGVVGTYVGGRVGRGEGFRVATTVTTESISTVAFKDEVTELRNDGDVNVEAAVPVTAATSSIVVTRSNVASHTYAGFSSDKLLSLRKNCCLEYCLSEYLCGEYDSSRGLDMTLVQRPLLLRVAPPILLLLLVPTSSLVAVSMVIT